MPIVMDRKSPTPLYRQLREELSRQIAEGRLREGDRLPPMRELSRHYGVSFVTAVRAMTDLARDGVVTVRRGSGAYVAPQQVETNIECLASGHPPWTPGLVSFHAQLFDGLRRGTTPNPCRLWVSYLDGRFPPARELLDVARSRRLKGLAVYRPPAAFFESLRETAERLPVAIIGGAVPDSRADAVAPDPSEGLRAMLRRRIAAGARAFAWIGFAVSAAPDPLSPYDIMRDVFQRTLAEHGIEPFIHTAPAGLIDPHWDTKRLDAHLAHTAEALPEGCVTVCQTAHVAEQLLTLNRRFDALSYTENRETLQKFRAGMSLLYVGIECLAREAVRLLLSRAEAPGQAGRTARVAAEVMEASA